MIHTLLLRFSAPGLYKTTIALKRLRELVYCLALGTPDRRRIDKAKTRLHDTLQKTVHKRSNSKDIRLMRNIEQIMCLVEKNFMEIRDYKLAPSHETAWFFGVYISILDTLGNAITGHSWKSGKEAARAAGLIAAGRKQLGLFRTGHLSQPDDFLGNLKLTALYNDFDKWLDESEKLLENAIPAMGRCNQI